MKPTEIHGSVYAKVRRMHRQQFKKAAIARECGITDADVERILKRSTRRQDDLRELLAEGCSPAAIVACFGDG